MVRLIVVYKTKVKNLNGYKEPDIPDHVYNWSINEIKTEYTETGDIQEYFIVRSEMEDTEFEKIKPYVQVIKVMQL